MTSRGEKEARRKRRRLKKVAQRSRPRPSRLKRRLHEAAWVGCGAVAGCFIFLLIEQATGVHLGRTYP